MAPQNPLWRLRGLDKASPQFHKQLIDFLRGDEYQKVLPKLRNEDLTWFVEYLDGVLVDIPDHASPVFQESLRELRKVCGTKEVLPKSWTSSEPHMGCVYEGTFNGSKVRIRRVRVHPNGDPERVKEVAVMSKHLAHPNIVPFLGVTFNPLEVYSDWMPGGDLTGYLVNHMSADRLSLLSDVAEGLNYLHSCNVIHGDLKGSNILVDSIGHARITDFGLATATQDLDSIRSASDEDGQSTRWIAPEILDALWRTHSKEADIFSFAGVMVEVFTGAVPFINETPNAAVFAIKDGKRPPRPAHPALADGLWTLMQQCWDQRAHLRPHALRISCALGVPAWKRLIDYPLTLEKRIPLITDIFSDHNEVDVVGRLRGDDAQSFINVIDEMLENLGTPLRKKCLSTLCKICGREALLPRSLQVPLRYDRSGSALYSGGYADVWMGEHEGRKVAVKVLRVYETSNLGKAINRFCREVVTWKGFRHQNVLPLLGVTIESFAMVSEWMVNGNINEFVRAHRDVNRFELLKGVASGLIYLHARGMIHGDLKGANILINQSGHACLADFGLLTFVSDPTNPTASNSVVNAGTPRWMSPELFNPELFGLRDGRPTKESDYYALGMVILEVLSGQVPFAHHANFAVMWKVLGGERPRRPKGKCFTDHLWGTLEQCWSPRPRYRPTVDDILECLERVSSTWQPPSPGVEDEVETISYESVSTTSLYSSHITQ